MHDYVDANKLLPYGSAFNYQQPGDPNFYSTWCVGVLPFLEEQKVYDLFKFHRPVFDPRTCRR